MIVPSCKIHNDASCDISKDGKLLATFVPSAQGFPDDGVVAVYSLEKEYFGQCVFSKKFGKDSNKIIFKHIFLNTRSFIYSVIHSVCQSVSQSVSQSVIHFFFLLGGPERKCLKNYHFFDWVNREQS